MSDLKVSPNSDVRCVTPIATEENALDVITDIISDYMISVGKLLRLNYDNYAGNYW
jgi:hypothetical protein